MCVVIVFQFIAPNLGKDTYTWYIKNNHLVTRVSLKLETILDDNHMNKIKTVSPVSNHISEYDMLKDDFCVYNACGSIN